jgi:hypothetical protein
MTHGTESALLSWTAYNGAAWSRSECPVALAARSLRPSFLTPAVPRDVNDRRYEVSRCRIDVPKRPSVARKQRPPEARQARARSMAVRAQ